MINVVTLIGRLVRDVELKTTQTGKYFTGFTLAVQRDVKKQDGTYDVDFVDCQAWGKTAELLEKYTSKGVLLAVNGRVQVSSYQSKDGTKKNRTDIVVNNIQFMEKANTNYVNNVPETEDQTQDVADFGINADDLPF